MILAYRIKKGGLQAALLVSDLVPNNEAHHHATNSFEVPFGGGQCCLAPLANGLPEQVVNTGHSALTHSASTTIIYLHRPSNNIIPMRNLLASIGWLASATFSLYAQNGAHFAMDTLPSGVNYRHRAVFTPSAATWLASRYEGDLTEVRKYDAVGDAQWSILVDGPLIDFATDNYEGAYLLRYTHTAPPYESGDFRIMEHTFTLDHVTTNGVADQTRTFTILDRYYGNTGSSTWIHSSVAAIDANELVVMTAIQDIGSFRCYLTRIGASGTVLWNQQIGIANVNPMMLGMFPGTSRVLMDASGNVTFICAGEIGTDRSPQIVRLDATGALQWNTRVRYTNNFFINDFTSADLSPAGELVLSCNLETEVGSHDLLCRVASDGTLQRADLLSPATNGTVLWSGSGAVEQLGARSITRVLANNTIGYSRKRSPLPAVGTESLTIGTMSASRALGRIGLSGLIQYMDTVFAFSHLRPYFEWYDTDALPDDCGWVPNPRSIVEVPNTIMSVGPTANMVAVDASAWITMANGNDDLLALNNVPTLPLCALLTQVEENTVERRLIAGPRAVLSGTDIPLNAPAGEYAVLSNEGKTVMRSLARTDASHALSTSQLASGSYTVVWVSTDGSQRAWDRFVVN